MAYATVGARKIYYIQQGDQGLPVIFVHGAGANHLVWGAQMRALGRIAHVIAIDLPGHGKSDLPGCDSVEAYGDVILGLMDGLGFERAVIVGHSMGGAIAQMFALSHRDRVAGLGLIGTGARLRVLPAVLDGIQDDFENTTRLIIENSYWQPMDESVRRLAEEQLRACPAAVTHGDFIACDQFDVRTRLAAIQTPTLIVCGKQDQMAPPKYSEYLHANIANSQLELINGAGHSVMIEQAQAVNHALVEFMRAL